MYVGIEIIGDDRGVALMLRRMDTALNPVSMVEFLGITVEPYIQKRYENRFASEGDSVSGKWTPLQASTIAVRQAAGFGAGPINVRTGELEDYITSVPAAITPDIFGASLTSPGIGTQGGELETKLKTAQGGKAYPATPPRPVIGINQEDTAFVLTALSGFIVRKVAY